MAVDGLGEGVVIDEQHAPVALDERLEMVGCVVSSEELLVKHAVTTLHRGQGAAGDPEGVPSPLCISLLQQSPHAKVGGISANCQVGIGARVGERSRPSKGHFCSLETAVDVVCPLYC